MSDKPSPEQQSGLRPTPIPTEGEWNGQKVYMSGHPPVQPELQDRENAELVCCANATYTNFDSLLLKADGCGLLYEVVWFALWHMKNNPDLVIEEALDHGYHEWVK